MTMEERQKKITQLIYREQSVKTVALMKMFNVSSETIRRDFEALEKKSILKKKHGGAVIENLRSQEIQYTSRTEKNLGEKRAIGIAAAKLINDGDTIVMNSGTTVAEVALNLLDKNNLTIITNCIYIATIFLKSPSARVFLVGGELRNSEMTTSGYMGNEFLKRYRADKAIIGVGGIQLDSGITDYHIDESYITSQMINISGKSIVVSDFSKFDINAVSVICPIEQIDCIVTDWNLPSIVLSEYRKLSIDVIVAK